MVATVLATLAAMTILPAPARAIFTSITADSTWTADGGPYVIAGTLVIEDGATLTIEPGVVVRPAFESMMVVYGGLHCVGTADSIIQFNPLLTPNRWGGIGIQAGDGTIDIAYTWFYRTQPMQWQTVDLTGSVTAYDTDINVTDCAFEDDFYGGGVWYRDCTGLIARNTFTLYRAQVISVWRSPVDVLDNFIDTAPDDPIEYSANPTPVSISGNVILGSGDDGIDLDEFDGVVANNRIDNCFDKGISVSVYSTARLENNLVTHCGQGFGITAGAVADLWNNTLAENTFGLRIHEKHPGFGGPTVTGANMLIWDNTIPVWMDTLSSLTLTYSDVRGDTVMAGAGNLNLDPIFLDPGNDWHIDMPSPCIDAGQGDGAPPLDFEGDPRQDHPWIQNTGAGAIDYVDIGCDERVPEVTGVAPQAAAPAARGALLRVAPNPVGGRRTLRVEGEGPAGGLRGALRLYDVHGRQRRVWTSVALPAALTWDGRDARGRRLAAGIYFLEFRGAARPGAAAPAPARTRLVVVP